MAWIVLGLFVVARKLEDLVAWQLASEVAARALAGNPETLGTNHPVVTGSVSRSTGFSVSCRYACSLRGNSTGYRPV